jgi:hypothetical protein
MNKILLLVGALLLLGACALPDAAPTNSQTPYADWTQR